MQATYYPPQAYYPVQQVPSQAQYPPPQVAGSVPYVSHYVGAAPPRQDPYAYSMRHRYETYVPPPPEPAPKSKHQRSNTISTPNHKIMPLKSAMKKRTHERSESMGQPISRQSSRAPSEPREPISPTGRPRANSTQQYLPGHLFVMFPSSNEIRMENIALPSTVDEIRQNLLPMWPHRGSNDVPRESTFRAVFNGTPWASSGTDYIIARRMIHTLWGVLAHQGYMYQSTTHTGEPPTKLIFARAQHEKLPYFFSISVSQSGSKYSFLDAPPRIAESLSEAIRALWPHKVSADRRTEGGVFIFEVKKNAGGEVDRSLLAAYVLDYFNSIGFKLDGSIPMGKAGPLGFGSKKELWILRSAQQRDSSASGQNSVHGHNSAHGHSAHGHGEY
ncbi:uncharacterized protein PHACADRAFT_247419 [Phanerochaete carnosa HHB-10118-sp]|uniref:Uncharacterized protein n=1 Tax=Phanerochaete carnosa (strain HHB-10118-sp) TaxID=650164 RepID=K5VDK7_PHACS|nr:uncharacterized protein PHACADRAFT_247419 [Phanerochaete carnosa HHB-10118-sp]EKM61066.1 hypothetical protein PHACADRAFT_247419 [Phanerochaete carnosa HHB-10118-sp]